MSTGVAIKKDVVEFTAARVKKFQDDGELHLPANYSPENALKSAWLILQELLDRNKRPVLTTCTKESVLNSLLDMVVQGLNPGKNQCYFIAYGDKLACHRSYFGTMAVAMQVDDTITDIFAEVVYEADTFKYSVIRGRKEITEHEQALENIDDTKIKAAYCVVLGANDTIKKTEIMTFKEIKKAWAQSQAHPVDDRGGVKAGTVHGKFAAEMAKKTVVGRACKAIINASSDGHLLQESIRRTDELRAETEIEEDIEINANTVHIDIHDMEGERLDALVEPAPAPFAPTATKPVKNTVAGPGF